MVPSVIFENDRLVAALIVWVWEFVDAFVVERERARDSGRANNIGVHPERDAVVPAPVFSGKLSGCHEIFPLSATVNLSDISSGTNSQRMPPVFGAGVGQRHLSQAGERPGREIFHTVQQSRIEHLLIQPSKLGAVFKSRLHRHLGNVLLCHEKYFQTQYAGDGGNPEPA